MPEGQVLKAREAKGGILDSVMDHFEYLKDLVGIDHVTFGPNTLCGDHVGLHEVYRQALSIGESRAAKGNQAKDETPRATMSPASSTPPRGRARQEVWQ